MSKEAEKEQAVYTVMEHMASVQQKSQAFIDRITKKGHSRRTRSC